MRPVALLWVLAMSARAAAGAAAETPAEAPARPPAPSPAPGVVAALALSERLVEYGRQRRSASALVVAAQIRLDHPVEIVTFEKRTAAETGAEQQGAPGAGGWSPADAGALLREARTLAAGDAAITALIERLEQRSAERARGGVGGVKRHCDRIAAGARDSYTLPFGGAELAEVWVQGEADIDLDCSAFDEKQNLVDYADDCLLRWIPEATARFRLEIDNLAGVGSGYCLTTN